MAKKIAKPAPKPTPKPTPKPLPRPKPAPLDLVRNPNFDAAMAQRNYDNFIAEQRARMGAERSQSGNQDFIDNRDPNKATTMDMVDYIDPATGEKVSRTRGVVPAPGSRFVPVNGSKFNPNLMPEEEKQRLDKLVADFAMQGADQREADIARRNSLAQYGEAMRAGGAGYAQVDPNRAGYMPVDPNTNAPSLMPIQTPGSNALNQGQQMQNYQNFLQQGMQNSNTLNQGAMNNFANMQPGMQVTQTASRTTPNQTMPVAGMGMQQPKQTPSRKFSTVNNTPARFG
jgi:hypothetical protein